MSGRGQRASVRLAVSAMERATLGAPSELRNRYHEELLAEMHGLGWAAAWRYALGVAASAHAMRSALTGGDDGAVPAPTARRPLGCRLNVRHVWVTAHTADGSLYRECARCGKEYVPSGTAGVIGG